MYIENSGLSKIVKQRMSGLSHQPYTVGIIFYISM